MYKHINTCENIQKHSYTLIFTLKYLRQKHKNTCKYINIEKRFYISIFIHIKT